MFLDEGLIAKMRGLQDYKITVFLLLAVSPLWRGYLNRPAKGLFFYVDPIEQFGSLAASETIFHEVFIRR
ncbi:hypothetical protein SAMN05428967_3177 [Phyllobacterium sp. YR620]|jgi:hypothetical protein|nr:hypothetical protein SAMN05428967_3177 [Phyllobacterium sp. YR620]